MIAFAVTSLALLGCVGALRGHGASHFCYHCHHIDNPLDCTEVEKCWPEGHCGAQAVVVDGEVKFSLGCYDDKKCANNLAGLIGRRAHGHHEEVKCTECCDVENCNRALCSSFNTHAHNSHATTQAVVHARTTTAVQHVPCRDHVEDGFSCDMFDKSTVCTDFNPASANYFLAHTKCPNYCGFCDAQGNYIMATNPQKTTTERITVTTTQPPVMDSTIQVPTKGIPNVVTATTATNPTDTACVDHEENGFACVNFDLFHFCTDTSSFAHPLALEKCRKHCGFCTDDTDGR